jgi:hypothetical protein
MHLLPSLARLLHWFGNVSGFGFPILAGTEKTSRGDGYLPRVADGEDKAEAAANSEQGKEESQSNQLL